MQELSSLCDGFWGREKKIRESLSCFCGHELGGTCLSDGAQQLWGLGHSAGSCILVFLFNIILQALPLLCFLLFMIIILIRTYLKYNSKDSALKAGTGKNADYFGLFLRN